MSGRRWIYSLGLTLIAAGLLIVGGTWIRSGQNPQEAALAGAEYEPVEMTIDGAETASIAIYDLNSTIRLTRSPDGDIHVTGQQTKKDRLALLHDEEGKVCFSRLADRDWFDMIAIFPAAQDFTTIVALPEGYAGDVQATNDNGGIFAEDKSTSGALDLAASNAPVVVRNQAVKSLNVKTSNGEVILENIVSEGNVDVSGSNGSVDVRNLSVGGAFGAQNSNGALILKDVSAHEMRASTSNGKATAENVAAAACFSLHTSNADLLLNRVQASEFSVGTSNGSIAGSIVGDEQDYDIEAKTSNGQLRLPQGGHEGAPGKLIALTSNGDIDLEFVD